MNSNELNKLFKTAREKTGIDLNEMKKANESGRLEEFVGKNLSPKKAAQLKSVLSDKQACEKLLSTPEAKELLKKLTEGK